MKRIKNILLSLCILATGLQGCNGFLDVDIPDKLVKKDYWKTKDQVNAALTGVYTSLHNNLNLFLRWGDLRSELYDLGAKAEAKERQFVEQDIFPTNALVDWGEAYKGINWTNSFLKNARGAMDYDQTLTLEEVQAMESEAYAIRALYYFYLVRTFKAVPIIMEPYESDVQTVYYGASEESVVLDTIESDLQRALAHAPATFSSPSERYGRITTNAVKAIWADVKLWRGDYQGCVTLCEQLDAEYKNKMVAPTMDAWFSMFSQGNSSESIFEYQYLEKGLTSPLYSLFDGPSAWFIANMRGYQDNVNKIYQGTGESSFTDTIRTIGSTLNISESSSGISSMNTVFKYVGQTPGVMTGETRSGSSQSTVNFIFYRYREILLIKAEALAMLNDYTGATEAINTIRRATGLQEIATGDYGQGDNFMDKLLAERATELAFEGKQWFSMVRMARRNQSTELLIERIARNNTSSIKLQTMRARLKDPDSWFLPYLTSEVENNPYLEQKAYYADKN